MPTSLNPSSPDGNSHDIVELEGKHGGTTNGRFAHDLRLVGTPLKMFCPALGAWVKKQHGLMGHRINCVNFDAFIVVTQAASKPKIVFIICAAKRNRLYVFYFKWSQNILLLAEAVSTAILCLDTYSIA